MAAATPDLTVLRRHLHSLRKRGFLERAAMLQLAACRGLWPEQRHHEALLQDHAVCPRCDTSEIESEWHRFYFCRGNATGDPDLVDHVAKTDSIVSEARVGLTKPELRSFFLRGLTPGSWLVEEPYEGPKVFLVADAIHDGFHFGPGTYFTDGSKLYLDPRRREGVSVLSQQIFKCAQERMDKSHLTTLLCQWRIQRTGDVPVARRGPRLARLYKGKGTTESTDSYRGLLIGDHTAKVRTGVLAPEVKKAIEQSLPPQQCGSTKGGGTNRGHHLVSTFVRHARKHKIPAAILFMDLSKAFDKLVRQVVFGVSGARGDTDMIIDTLVRSGVDTAAASHLAPIIASSGGLLHQLKVPAHIICNMVGRLYDRRGFRSSQKENSS